MSAAPPSSPSVRDVMGAKNVPAEPRPKYVWRGHPGFFAWTHDAKTNKLIIQWLWHESAMSYNMFNWMLTMALYEVAGVGWGLVSLRHYSKVAGPGSSRRVKQLGWPEMPALTTGTSIMGSALSFLLVFRLSWSFGRWWEARGLIGTAMTKMRNLASMITANSGQPTAEQADALLELRLVSKLHIATMVDILVQDPAESDGQKKMRSSKSVRALILELSPKEVRALGEERARLLARSTRRILVVHSWLAHAIRTCCELQLLRAFEQDSALDCQNELLRCFYSSMKIKTTPMPGGIRAISLVVRFAFCVCLFPQYMAYAFVMKLSPEQHEVRLVWDKGADLFVTWFIVLTGLMIAFFSVIHIVALELDDPYGVDGSDLPMEKMRLGLWKDLDAVNEMYEDNNKLGGGEGLKAFASGSRIHHKMAKLAAKHKKQSSFRAHPGSHLLHEALHAEGVAKRKVGVGLHEIKADVVQFGDGLVHERVRRQNSYAAAVVDEDDVEEEEDLLEETLELAMDEDEGDDAPAVENVAAESDDAFRASAAAELVEQVCIGDQADEAAAEEKDHFDDSGDEPQHDTMTAAEKQLEEARKKLEAAKAKAASPTKLDA